MNIKEYFRELRFSPAHHLGAGDIRLTMGQQEEIETELAAEREKVAKLKDTIRRARTKFCEDGSDGKIAAEMFQILGESREETK